MLRERPLLTSTGRADSVRTNSRDTGSNGAVAEYGGQIGELAGAEIRAQRAVGQGWIL